MRLGLIGPAGGDLEGLALAAELLLNTAKVDKAIYLGDDLALEEVVAAWAASLVGADPSDEGIWTRARDVALFGSTARIDEFVHAERARLRLRALETLPPALRGIEMFGDRVAILIYDKALLDEEDIFSATFLIYGRSDAPLAKKIGTRWFLTPGRIGGAGGCLVLDDEEDDVRCAMYDRAGTRTFDEPLPVARAAKIRVQGETP